MSRFAGSLQAEESFRRWEAERKEKRNQYWRAIMSARSEYMTENKGVFDLTARPTVHYWMRMKYGIIMEMDSEGNYTQDFEVEDKNKFLIFQLKHWQ